MQEHTHILNGKKIQNNWGNELAKGDVNVKVKIKIAGMGTIK